MPEIPQRKYATIQEFKRIIVENASKEERKRDYIGASEIGEKCSRKIWYNFNGYEKQPSNIVGLLAAEDGHTTEDLISKRLRLIPSIELYTHDENGEQFGFDLGFFKGHYDGVIRGVLEAPKTWHIYEVKTKEEKFINKLIKIIDTYGEKKALEKWDYKYYCQAVVYMYMEDLTRHYMIVSKPGGRGAISLRTDENKKLAQALIDKATRIYKLKTAPERAYNSKDYFECAWCQFRDECWK